MEITNEVRMSVINDLLEELARFGHYQSVTHVEGCRARLMTKMGNKPVLVETKMSKVVNG